MPIEKVEFSEAAAEFLLTLDDVAYQQVRRIIISLLLADPWLEGRHKTSLAIYDIMLQVYENEGWRIIYHIRDNTTLAIISIRPRPRTEPQR